MKMHLTQSRQAAKEDKDPVSLSSFAALRLGVRFFLLLDLEQFDLEFQFGVRWNDVAGAALAVTEFRRDDQRPFTADAHAGDPFVPTLDDPAGPEFEAEHLVAVTAAIELFAVLGQPAGVVDLDRVSGLGLVAGPFLGVDVLEPGL